MMRLPATYLQLLAIHRRSEVYEDTDWAYADDQRRIPVPDHAVVYPPVGFLPWPFCDFGNGDYYGYYWPVGREEDEPVVGQMSHGCGALNPIASSVETLARLEPYLKVNSLLTSLASGANRIDDDIEDEEECEYEPSNVAERLKLDDRSPFLLTANADVALAQGDLPQAESLYARAVGILPEYTAALYGLAVVSRRLRRPEEAVKWALEAIRAPLCFRGATGWSSTFLPEENLNRNDWRRKCLHWLRQARPEHSEAVADDPLFEARHRLSFASGTVTNEDYFLYDEIIEEYVKRGQPIEAVKLAMVYGELMLGGETVSFQERYGFSPASHRQRLLRLFREAGLESRARLLEQP